MLWTKESIECDAMYVDICGLYARRNVPPADRTVTKTLAKSNAISAHLRQQGNDLFTANQLCDAMDKYNASLCFAEPGTECQSLAYANRSSCFLKMKMFHECCVDIDLAKAAGYPEESMWKLDQRKATCLEAIDKNNAEGSNVTKNPLSLSFPPDEQLPCIANVLKIVSDDQLKDKNDQASAKKDQARADKEHSTNSIKYSVIAKEDIDIGQTILVEKAFFSYVYSQNSSQCSICFKENVNLMPCQHCTRAAFCSTECQDDLLHKYECGLRLDTKDANENGNMMKEVRLVMMAVNLFPSVDELMQFVEESIQSEADELPTFSNEKSKYRAFLTLPIASVSVSNEFLASIILRIYNIIQSQPNLHFQSKKHRRFLMHLIGHHCQITSNNSMRVTKDASGEVSYTQTGLIPKYFQHSCAPNVFMGTRDGHFIYITIRPIKKGGQLYISNFMSLLRQPKDVRQQVIWTHRRIKCECARCEGIVASANQRRQMASDSDFKYIFANSSTHSIIGDISVMHQRCQTFLTKYGHMNWCDELGIVLSTYVMIVNQILKPKDIICVNVN